MSDLPSIAVELPKPEKKPHGLIGRKVTSEKQLAALRAGMEALKVKREQQKIKKAEIKEKKKLGLPVDDSSSEDEKPKAEAGAPAVVKPIIQYIPVKPRKERKDTGVPRQTKNYVVREDFDAFKNSILETIKTTGVIKEIEKPVERIVEKETIKEVPVHSTKVLTGSDMLNKIFGFDK
jgi:hypothetical protein